MEHEMIRFDGLVLGVLFLDFIIMMSAVTLNAGQILAPIFGLSAGTMGMLLFGGPLMLTLLMIIFLMKIEGRL